MGDDTPGVPSAARGVSACPRADIASTLRWGSRGRSRSPARVRNRRKELLSALHHIKAPHKFDFLWKTRRALNRPWEPGPSGEEPQQVPKFKLGMVMIGDRLM